MTAKEILKLFLETDFDTFYTNPRDKNLSVAKALLANYDIWNTFKLDRCFWQSELEYFPEILDMVKAIEDDT